MISNYLFYILAFLGISTFNNAEQQNPSEPVYKNYIQQQKLDNEITDPTKSEDDTDIYRLNNGHSEIG